MATGPLSMAASAAWVLGSSESFASRFRAGYAPLKTMTDLDTLNPQAGVFDSKSNTIKDCPMSLDHLKK